MYLEQDLGRPDTLYTTVAKGGFSVLDVLEDGSLGLSGQYIDDSYHQSIRVSGDLATLQYGGTDHVTDRSFDIIDLSTRSSPRLLKRLYTDSSFSVREAPIYKNHLLVIRDDINRERNAALGVWDLRDPRSPVELDALDLSGITYNLHLSEDQLLVPRYSEKLDPIRDRKPAGAMLDQYNLSDPARPQLIRSIDFGASPGYQRGLPLIDRQAELVFIIAQVGLLKSELDPAVKARLYVIQLGPGPARTLATLDLEPHQYPQSIKVVDGYGFVNTRCANGIDQSKCGLLVFDLRQPSRPQLVAQLPKRRSRLLWDFVVHDGRIYVAAGPRGVEVFEPELSWVPGPAIPTYTPQPPTATHTPSPTLSPTPSPTPTAPEPERTLYLPVVQY